MYLNYSNLNTFKLLIEVIENYTVLKAIILVGVVLTILLFINKNSNIVKYFILIINILLIILLLNYYGTNIFNGFNNYLDNLYGFIFNSILFLIIIPILFIKKTININILIPIYILGLIHISSAIYITYYFNNTLYILGDLYPIVKFGNYLYILNLAIILLNITRRINGRKRNK